MACLLFRVKDGILPKTLNQKQEVVKMKTFLVVLLCCFLLFGLTALSHESDYLAEDKLADTKSDSNKLQATDFSSSKDNTLNDSLLTRAVVDNINGKPIKKGNWHGFAIEYLAGEMIVKLKSDANRAKVKNLLRANNTYLINEFDETRWGLIGCDIRADVFEKISRLLSSPLIEWAEPNLILYPALETSDTYLNTQYALKNIGQTIISYVGSGTLDADIDATEAWNIETGDSTLLIAVLDSGIPVKGKGNILCHPDLMDEYKFDLSIAYNCSGDTCVPAENSSVRDECAHGTHVTGIISATTNNDEGIAGVIWKCKIMTIVVFQPKGTGWSLVQGIYKALHHGAKIINFSAGGLGGYVDSLCSDSSKFYSRHMEDALDSAWRAGCLIVTISGNEGPNTFRFPGGFASWGTQKGREKGYRNVIAVGNTDNRDSLWITSSYCDSLDVTVVAPGTKILSTFPTYVPDYLVYCLLGPDPLCYHWCIGTSMAAPHVTGVAGLILSKNPSLSPDSVRTIIENTTDDVEDIGWDKKTGFGRVNALKALVALDGYYPSATGILHVDATWKDTIYMIGDVIIPDYATLTINPGTVVKVLPQSYEEWGTDSNKVELIVEGKLRINGTENYQVTFMSNHSTPSAGDWYGIRVKDTDSASAIVKHANIYHAYCGVDYQNSATDTVDNCFFYHNQGYGILCDNPNLCIISNEIKSDTTGSDTTKYGIYLEHGRSYSLEVKGNRIEGCKYGFYLNHSSATLRHNYIHKGHTGLYANLCDSVTLRFCCFEGPFEECFVKSGKSRVYIDSCRTKGSPLTPIGLWYMNFSKGSVYRSRIEGYDDVGVYCYWSNPDLGSSFSNGHNYIAGGDTAVKNNAFFPVSAKYNFWGTSSPNSSLFSGSVNWVPCLTQAPILPNPCNWIFIIPDPYDVIQKLISTNESPKKFTLFQNYPNPFNPVTEISYALPKDCHVTLTVYNILGQKVKALVNQYQPAGYKQIRWDGKDDQGEEVASGVYFYHLKAGDFTSTRKMLLSK